MNCKECGCEEGQFHKEGCSRERCPICGGLLNTCTCQTLAKSLGCTKVVEQRIPFIDYPIFCAKCGKAWPHYHKVDQREWEKYIQPDKRNSVICIDCFKFIKKVIDDNEKLLK